MYKRDWRRPVNPLGPATALVDPCSSAGHAPDFDGITVFARAGHFGRRLTIEALIISDNSMNVQRDADRISF